MKVFSFIMLLLVSTSCVAQDLIVTNSGDVIKGYNIEISQESVYYTLSIEPKSEIRKIDKSEVLAIRKENGDRITFENATAKVASRVNNVIQSVKQTFNDVRDQITDRHSLPANFHFVTGDANLPVIDIDKYHGFLLQKGNVVYVEAGLEDYDEVGANRLRELLKEDGFWKLAYRKEQAHFIIRYRVITEGSDHIDQYWLDTREGLPQNIKKRIHASYDINGGMYPIHANEDFEDNIKFADKLYKRIEVY